MSKKRIHEIAKEHGLASKELLERLRAAGVEAKTASSSVEEALALKALGNGGSAVASAAEAAPPSANGADRAAAPASAGSGRRCSHRRRSERGRRL